MIAEAPRLLGDAQAAADLGGAGEHLARRWKLPIPRWVHAEARYLARALFDLDEPALRAYLIGVAPVSFRVRPIFTGPDALQRARFPYRRGVIRVPMTHPPSGRGSSSPLHRRGATCDTREAARGRRKGGLSCGRI